MNVGRSEGRRALKDEISAYWKEFMADTSNQLAVRGRINIQTDEHLQS